MISSRPNLDTDFTIQLTEKLFVTLIRSTNELLFYKGSKKISYPFDRDLNKIITVLPYDQKRFIVITQNKIIDCNILPDSESLVEFEGSTDRYELGKVIHIAHSPMSPYIAGVSNNEPHWQDLWIYDCTTRQIIKDLRTNLLHFPTNKIRQIGFISPTCLMILKPYTIEYYDAARDLRHFLRNTFETPRDNFTISPDMHYCLFQQDDHYSLLNFDKLITKKNISEKEAKEISKTFNENRASHLNTLLGQLSGMSAEVANVITEYDATIAFINLFSGFNQKIQQQLWPALKNLSSDLDHTENQIQALISFTTLYALGLPTQTCYERVRNDYGTIPFFSFSHQKQLSSSLEKTFKKVCETKPKTL